MKPKLTLIRAACIVPALLSSQAKAVAIFTETFELPVVFDFDSSVFSAGWTLNESTGDQLALRNGLLSHDGIQAAQINANNSPTGSSFSRSIPTVIGQQYTLSLWYLSYASTAAAVKVDFGSSSASSPVTPSVNTWYELTFDHTATSTSTTLTITDITTNTVSSDLMVDAIGISSVPEPSGAGLLGLGTCVVFFRRKRKTGN